MTTFAEYLAAQDKFETNAQKIVDIVRAIVYPDYNQNHYFSFQEFSNSIWGGRGSEMIKAGEGTTYLVFEITVADHREIKTIPIETSWLENFDQTAVTQYAEQMARQAAEQRQRERDAAIARQEEIEKQQLIQLQAKYANVVLTKG